MEKAAAGPNCCVVGAHCLAAAPRLRLALWAPRSLFSHAARVKTHQKRDIESIGDASYPSQTTHRVVQGCVLPIPNDTSSRSGMRPTHPKRHIESFRDASYPSQTTHRVDRGCVLPIPNDTSSRSGMRPTHPKRHIESIGDASYPSQTTHRVVQGCVLPIPNEPSSRSGMVFAIHYLGQLLLSRASEPVLARLRK